MKPSYNPLGKFYDTIAYFCIILSFFGILLSFYNNTKSDETEIPKEVEIRNEITDDDLDECDNEVYAGRYDKSSGKYDKIGLPTKREWLTSKEWRGDHVKGDTLFLFKRWKKKYISEFINWMSQEAIIESTVYDKIPPSLIVAQLILESNYGKSRLACEANNFFGHKYRGKDKDKFIIAADDSPNDKFTKYRSKWFSMRAHSKLLMKSYYPRLKGKPTLENWLIALCGSLTESGSRKFVSDGNYVYATSCYKGGYCYASKIKHIVNKYKLKRLDAR